MRMHITLSDNTSFITTGMNVTCELYRTDAALLADQMGVGKIIIRVSDGNGHSVSLFPPKGKIEVDAYR
jgi:hypothetical protein